MVSNTTLMEKREKRRLNKRAVLRVLRQHDPAAADYGEDDAATLWAHFLDRKALELLRTQAELSDCVALIDHRLATGLKLEQQAVGI